MSVNDKWHYCHNCEVLVGSRAMRDRHLKLLGYIILQVSRIHHSTQRVPPFKTVPSTFTPRLARFPDTFTYHWSDNTVASSNRLTSVLP